jgi:transposase-like protein
MNTNPTDARIVKLAQQGASLARIAKRIGRPTELDRVRKALERAGIAPKN